MTTGSILYVDENGDLTWSKLDTFESVDFLARSL